MSKAMRGFAVMSLEKRRAIASKGGRSQGRHNNKGNFANDPKRASKAGKKGGANSWKSDRAQKRVFGALCSTCAEYAYPNADFSKLGGITVSRRKCPNCGKIDWLTPIIDLEYADGRTEDWD